MCTFFYRIWQQHIFLADKELVEIWRAAATVLNIGVLHAQQLTHQISDSCARPLYVVLNRDQHILSEVRYVLLNY
jgi:hypothetical protein